MKSKGPINTGIVVPAEFVAEQFLTARVKPVARCIVCSGEATPGAEQLCWVCRRLKISAWRESDPQASAQE